MKIKAIRSALPKTAMSAQTVADYIGADAEFVSKKVGAANRYMLGPDETGTDLSQQACDNLFRDTDLKPENVELLIVVTQTPDYAIPHNSALLQARLNLPTTCAAFDISLGCSGYVYAMSICKGLMAAQNITNAVLVTCDPYSKIMDKHDRGTMAVFGDAASASWLSADDGAEMGLANMGTDGSFAEHLIIKSGGAVNPVMSIHQDSPSEFDKDDARLHMYGRGIFEFVMKNVPLSIQAALDINDVTRDDIDYFALHQGSLYMLNLLARRAKIPAEKLLYNIQDYGNTVSSSVPMLLETLIAEGKATPGTKVLVSGFGVGLSWATNVVSF
jgi:3-oxoacyl-[acyl-carrier-protein] synthase-3